MAVPRWIANTHRGRGEPEPAEPRTWELASRDRSFRLVVTRTHGLPGWWMHAYGLGLERIELEAEEIGAAKAEAIEICRTAVAEIAATLDGAKG
jgi:hypothetical protein